MRGDHGSEGRGDHGSDGRGDQASDGCSVDCSTDVVSSDCCPTTLNAAVHTDNSAHPIASSQRVAARG